MARPHASPSPAPSHRVRRNRVVAGAVVLVVVGLLAVTLTLRTSRGGDVRPQQASPRPSATTGWAGTGSPAAPPSSEAGRGRRPPRGNGQAVTIAFGGDVHFEGRIRSQLDADPSRVMAGVAPILEGADLAMVNLETAVTTRGTKPPAKQYAFRAPASAFAALRAGGVDVASMANNHGMDYGRQGLEDSLDAAKAGGFPVVGIGRNATEAYRPFVKEVRGQRIAVIGATQVLDDDLRAAWTATDTQPGLASAKELDRLTGAVKAVRAEADTVVVFLHWGTEGQECPNEVQPVLARALADAGADIIVGGHAHRLQGAGRLGPAFVAYGLGNFVFYADTAPATDTGVLTVAVTGREVDRYEWTPARLVAQLPRPLRGAAAEQASAAWDRLRRCTGLIE